MRHWVAILVLTFAAPAARAQPHLMVMIDTGTGYSAVGDVAVGSAFDIVVNMDSGGWPVSAAEFSFPALEPLAPGIFRVETAYPSSPPGFVLDVPEDGVYRLDFDGCAAPCETRELLRITYFDFAFSVGADVVLTVQGVAGPDSDPVLTDCDGGSHAAPMAGVYDFVSGADVFAPAGSLMLNPTPMCVLGNTGCVADGRPYAECDAVVEADASSLTMLKSRYLR